MREERIEVNARKRERLKVEGVHGIEQGYLRQTVHGVRRLLRVWGTGEGHKFRIAGHAHSILSRTVA